MARQPTPNDAEFLPAQCSCRASGRQLPLRLPHRTGTVATERAHAHIMDQTQRNCCSQATISFRAAIGLDRRASALRIPGCYGFRGAHRRLIGIGAIRALAVEPGRDHDWRGLGRAVCAAGCRLIERHRHPTVRRREVRQAVIFAARSLTRRPLTTECAVQAAATTVVLL